MSSPKDIQSKELQKATQSVLDYLYKYGTPHDKVIIEMDRVEHVQGNIGILLEIREDKPSKSDKGFTNLIETKETHLLNGSSFHDHTITTTYNKLKEVFGKAYEDNSGDKVSVEFELKLDNGIVFTIYDWKEYGKTPLRFKDKEFDFHIGGFKKEETYEALNFISNKLKEKEGELK